MNMNKEPKLSMYKNFTLKDAFVIILSLIAIAGLIFMVKYSKDRSKLEQEQLIQTSDFTQVEKNTSLSESTAVLIINEVNQAGWIELYNKGRNIGIELANCYVTVNGEKKFTFPATAVVPAEELFVVDGLGQLGFNDHNIIGIFDGNGVNLKNIMIPRLAKDESYGCAVDGEISYSILSASKAKTNGESRLLHSSNLSFSVPGGFYIDSFLLELTSSDNLSIYYTLDGSEPTTESILYEAPILIENKSGSNMQYATAEGIDYLYSYKPSSISKGMIVRAIAVDRAGKIFEHETQSYFVGLKNASDIKNIPVLSITTSPENLFDYFEGIYVTGSSREDAIAKGENANAAANYFNDWKREVYVEYFEPQKDKTYQGTMSLRIMNDISVTLAQKSLLLTGKGGAFAGSSLENYFNSVSNQLVVQTNERDNTYKIREYLAGKLLANTTVGTPDITPCIVFLNGEYWGGYMLKAEYDEAYIQNHYGVDRENVLIAQDKKVTKNQQYQQKVDEFYNFIATHDLKDQKNYEWVKDHMDVQNFLEYFCANMYLANAQYKQDRFVMWRSISENGSAYEDGRWRFLMPKLDNTMENGMTGQVATSSINTFLQPLVMEDILFKSLLRNEEFKKELMIVMTDMSEKVFTSNRVNDYLTEISGQMKKMVDMSYKRFSGNMGDSYSKEVDKISNFFERRGEYILRYTKEVLSWGGSSNVNDDAVSK